MKKTILPLLIIAISSLVGCNKDPGFVVNDDTKLSTKTWDNSVTSMIAYTCGGCANLFPHLEGDSYYTYIETIDGTKCTIMNVYMKSFTDVIDNYELSLENSGFVVSGDSYYGYHIFEEVYDAVVQYNEIEDLKKPYIELIFYKTKTRYKTFQNDLVETVLGTTLPVPQASSYSAYFDSYSMQGSIYANNVAIDCFTKYHQALINTEKFVLKEDTAYYNTYSSVDGYLYIDISLSFDEYGRDSLLIRFKNNWPRVEITSLLGGMDIPKFSDVYYEGCLDTQYVDLTGDGNPDCLEIIFDDVDEQDYASYVSKYILDGWHLDSESSDTSKWLTKSTKVEGKDTEFEIGVLLGQFPGYSYKSIVVVIYL